MAIAIGCAYSLPSCSHPAVVHYDEAQAQPNTRVDFQAGLLWLQGKPLDTKFMATAFSGPGYAIYVMSRDGHMHLSPHVIGGRHHTSLLAGADVAGAGETQVGAGRLVWLSNKSGHYHPDIHQLLQTLDALQQGGVPFAFRMKVFGAGPRVLTP